MAILRDRVVDDGIEYAIIIRKDNYVKAETSFYTGEEDLFQVGTIYKGKDEEVKKHTHNDRTTTVTKTSEFLIVTSGAVIVNIYSGIQGHERIASVVLERYDSILLIGGWHEIKSVTGAPFTLLEVKQGPYLKDGDKRLEK
jgi:mannose-6-phosphate isomerase-like protein (cupin superfamily)